MTTEKKPNLAEKDSIRKLIEKVLDLYPIRRPTSPEEKGAQLFFAKEFEQRGLKVEVEDFAFNDHLYKNLALHFSLGLLATAIAPLAPAIAFFGHLLVGLSLYLDSSRRINILRRLLQFKPSRNILGYRPAAGRKRLSIVINAHADSAYTGFVFNPDVVKNSSGPLPKGVPSIFGQPMRLIAFSFFLLAAIDPIFALGRAVGPIYGLSILISAPAIIGLMLNMQVVFKNEIVPGANDNLSGCAALAALADRFAENPHPDLELVYLITGCEEAGVGGSAALAKAKKGTWPVDETIFISLDSISGGQLKYLPWEGDIVPRPIPERVRKVIDKTAASQPRFAGVAPFEIPVGGTDNLAFLAHGFGGAGFVAIDPEIGAPRHYHLPSDTLENLDMDQLMYAIDFIELLVRNLAAEYLGAPSEGAPAKGKK